MTKPGRQWIHADAGYYRDPLVLKIKERFGWSGVIFFDAFLRGCKRSVPQGQVVYVTEDELVHFLGVADLMRVSCDGHAWSISDFWRFLSRRRPSMVTSRRVDGRVVVTSCAWDAWEMSATRAFDAERKRRSRGQKRPTNVRTPSDESAWEVGGWRGEKEVGGGSARGDSDLSPASPQGAEARSQKTNGAGAATNGAGRPDPTALVAMVSAIESKTTDQDTCP